MKARAHAPNQIQRGNFAIIGVGSERQAFPKPGSNADQISLPAMDKAFPANAIPCAGI
jgi:hypothetical protein